MKKEEKPSKLCIAAAKALHRAERDYFAELDRAFGIKDYPQQRVSKWAHNRDSNRVFLKLWNWACKRWPDFPYVELNIRLNERGM